MELTEIIFDTNLLRKREIEDFSEFSFSCDFESFIDFLGSNDIVDKYRIVFSKITLEELRKQIIDSYNKELSLLKKCYNKLGNIHDIKFEQKDINFSDVLDRNIKEYIDAKNYMILDISEKIFKNIVDRAINKKKPFLGEKGESDKGFKDAILWESLIQHANEQKISNFYLITKNSNDFPKDILEKEFYQLTYKNIKIFNSIEELQKNILSEQNINIKTILTTEILSVNEELLLEKVMEYCDKNQIQKEFMIVSDIYNLVNQGNNFYTFWIDTPSDEYVFTWSLNATFKNDELIIDDIIPVI